MIRQRAGQEWSSGPLGVLEMMLKKDQLWDGLPNTYTEEQTNADEVG